MAYVDRHHYHRLHILELTVHDAHRLLLLQQSVLLLGLELYGAVGFLLYPLQQFFLAFFEERYKLVCEDELAFDFRLGVV